MKKLAFFLTAILFAGCTEKAPDSVKQDPPAIAGDQSKLDVYTFAEKPAKTISVKDALKGKEGDKIVVAGQVPPVKVKPFNSAVAAFLLISPEDMAREEVKEEFECDDAATCPGCRKLLDELAVQVEVVDASGKPVAATLEGFRGLKPGGMLTVEGVIQRYGKDKKLVRIVATKFYPG